MCKSLIITLMLLAFVSVAVCQENPDEAVQSGPGSSDTQLTLDDLRTFTDVFSQIRRNYVEEVDDKTLLNAAIKGMLSDLDPHSSYLPADDYKQLDDSAHGRFSGIGVDVGIQGRKIVVRRVISPSPADRGGINPGDIITAIDGNPVRGRLLRDALDEIKGEPGSTVTLTILPSGPGGKERKVELVREYVNIPAMSFKLLDQHFGYFRISFFHKNSAINLAESLASIEQDGIELRGLIIDLRNNPGGVLQTAVEMADGFLQEGLIVTTKGRNATMQMEFRASAGEWLPGVPLIVLVNRGSASASEVLAGALQDHGRALIVGERTFGKGSVQSILPLRNGAGIKLTTARYYTPSGRSIQAEGIRPDLVVERVEILDANDQRLREADLQGHLSNDTDTKAIIPDVSVRAEDDFPLHEALSILKGAGILSASIRSAGAEQIKQEK
ncbi:MAG: S41 family peptidase [Proteobacteria bacterium]|nr:S41 family peptidase [Pseudomonadota bacterium]